MTKSTKKILILGASSYLGARVYFDLRDKYALSGTYFHNRLSDYFFHLNLTDNNSVSQLFNKINPDVIIHFANYSNTKYALENKEKFAELNEKATEYVVQNSNRLQAKVIFISSVACENPNNIYGELKIKSEKSIKKIKSGYIILRPSLIFGMSPNTMSNKPFNKIIRCLNTKTKSAAFDTSWKFQPTYIGHVSQTINQIIQKNIWNKTITIFINEVVTKYQIANDILCQFDYHIKPLDLHINIQLSKDSLTNMRELNLTPSTYKDMIKTIITEIKHNQKQYYKV